MCEILLMLKTDNTLIKKSELERFLYRCVIASNSNRDGYGAMCENWFMRSVAKMETHDVKNILNQYEEDSRFFAVHVRFATCEKKEEFTHPFANKRFMLVHNGVVNVDNEKSGSDSLDFFNALDKEYETDFVKAIKETTKKTSGSFSVLTYVYSENALYYFRNSPIFDFMLCENENVIYGATDIDRLKPLQKKLFGFFETAHESRPLRETIYKIDLASAKFERCGNTEDKPITTYKPLYQADLSGSGALPTNNEHKKRAFDGDNYGIY